LWNAYHRYHGQDDSPALTWHAPTRTMNRTVPQSVVDRALEEDPAKAGAEYLAEFRTDVETYIPREVVDAAIEPGRYELPPSQHTAYLAFVDPSGGRSDSMTCAVAHRDPRSGNFVLDAVRERRPPFSPEQVVSEFATLFKTYHISRVQGVRYAGEWPVEQFRKLGITYEPSADPKSTIYTQALPHLSSGKCELLDIPRLAQQIVQLERRTARGGKDSIDHPTGAHDDLANSALAALVLAATKAGPLIISDELLRAARARPPYRPHADYGSLFPGHFDNRPGRRNY